MSRPDYRLYLLPFTTIRDLAPLFSPNRYGTCEAADNLTVVKVGIRLPSFFSTVISSASASSKTDIQASIRGNFACKQEIVIIKEIVTF